MLLKNFTQGHMNKWGKTMCGEKCERVLSVFWHTLQAGTVTVFQAVLCVGNTLEDRSSFMLRESVAITVDF